MENETLLKVFDFISDAIFAVDKEGKVMFINAAAKELIDANPNAVGKHYKEAFGDNAINDFLEFDKNRLEMQKDDKFYRLKKSPIEDYENGIVIQIQEITEMKKLERLRSEFMSNVTHELKTPLTSIRGFAETLKDGAIDNKKSAMKFIEIIEIESERLTHLIDDILSLSQVEMMIEDVGIEIADIEEIVESIKMVLSPIAEQKNIKVTSQIKSTAKFGKANEERLEQILLNLVANAIHYTPEGGAVNVLIYRQSEDIIFEVSDNGIGISEEHIPHVFERFYRVSKSRNRKDGGTGLGLSIVKHICQLYGGSVNVRSQLGKGSTFIVNLPIAID